MNSSSNATVTQLRPSRSTLFEGQQVDDCRAKLTATTSLDIAGSHELEDLVRLDLIGQVTAVAHVIDQRSGRLIRVHTIRVLEAEEVPGA